ncbi:MAG: hypothetical protein JNJ98_10000, partial [Gemmatimonadetes bacterium]|nr:hypothetical protein [Gemmatimonadota bacterium]
RGDLVVALTDTTQGARVLAELARTGTGAAASAHRGAGRTGRTRLVTADYSFLQLAAWRDDLFETVLDVPEMEFLDLDERANRIVIGLTDARAISALAAVAAQRRIPDGAVEYQVVAPGFAFQSLADRVRPAVGGLEVFRIVGNLAQSCTLGLVVRRIADNGYLMNSHCTTTFWGLDTDRWFQATANAFDVLGDEIHDPPGFACGFRGRKTCRYSDAAFVREGVVPRRLGHIARPTFVTTVDGAAGSIEIDSLRPTFDVVSTATGISMGDFVDKVGIQTGWSTGEVERTCSDLRGPTLRHRVLCQDEVKLYADFGDSGSPAFVFLGGSVQARGVLWGGRRYAVRRQTSFISPMANIILDLGAMSATVP